MVISATNITVVIPVFNRPLDLARALDSLVKQSIKSFFVIVVDDGSTDDIKSICDLYSHTLHLTYKRIDNSGGPARPRNVGIRAANTDWISFLDSDDWWKSNRIEIILQEIKKHVDIDIFYHQLEIVTADYPIRFWSRKTIGHSIGNNPFVDLLVRGDALPNSSVTIKKICFEKFGYLNESIDYASVEDYDCWLNMAANDCKFYYINKTLGFYYLSKFSISLQTERSIHRNYLLLSKYLPKLDENNKQFALGKFYYLAGSAMYADNNLEEAVKYFRKASSLVDLTLHFKRILKILMIALGIRLAKSNKN